MKHTYTGGAIKPITKYFNRAFMVYRQAESLKERIKDLRAMHSETDNVEVTTVIDETVTEHVAKLKELLDFQTELERLINTVESDRRRLCLFERYVNLKSWGQIARDNFYAHEATPNKLARYGLNDIARNNPQFCYDK